MPFRFFKVWTSHTDCVALVKEIWSKPAHGNPMTVFGNIDSQVKLAVDEVNRIQNLIDESGVTDDLQQLDYNAQLILTKTLLRQDQFWRDKARVQHFMQGDRNTSYYHRLAKIKAVTKQIHFLNSDTGVLSNSTEIENHIVNYFKAIFCGANSCLVNNMVNNSIPSTVTDEDNAMLTLVPFLEEIKASVFALNGDGAP
ncbi:RNA-directed DNA polymerase (Reverse transcriptase), partial [Trifolium medium]|nr:RNA-directed DNA polymerase (Reverse transcriptase) [Trifolium medium]